MLSGDQFTLCPNCCQDIESSKYFLHERMCILNVKKCPKCNKPFNIDDLNDHIKSEHTFITCDLCNIKFPNSEIEEHNKNCLCQLVPCKYCELNVLLKELEEHEEICGSTTEKCLKCGLYIEKKNYPKHICLNKETEYLNENIKIDDKEEEKMEKKKIKNGLEKNTYKMNKIMVNIGDKNKNGKNKKINKSKTIENEELYNIKENKKKNATIKNKIKKDKLEFEINDNNINLDMIYNSPQELQNQIKVLNKFEKMNKINEINNNIKNKKKNKNKNKGNKDEKEEEFKIQNEIKNKKGKKNKVHKNSKLNKNEDDNKYYGEEEYFPGNKNMDLHNIKWDIPPDKYKNYNNVGNYDYGVDYNLEENLIQEAIKLSLIEK